MVKKQLLFCLLLFAICSAAAADNKLTIETNISTTALQTRNANTGDKYWGGIFTGYSDLSFKSSGSRNVKADLAFTLTSGSIYDSPVINLNRAYIKARFPVFRVTAGKTRLSWGDGFVFNSADVLFGSTGTNINLTDSEIRTETDWLVAVNVPIGSFSFIEGVIMAPDVDTIEGYYFGQINKVSAGARFYTKLGSVKLEGGYFFDQSTGTDDVDFYHKPYIALQGNLFLDWYLSSSLGLSTTDNIEEDFEENLNISGGLFYLLPINSISSMTFRLEALYRPFQNWSEIDRTTTEEEPEYALLLYPEITYSPIDTLNISTRAVVSPVDGSAMLAAGCSWNIFEGFDLSLYTIANIGDGSDTFSWNRDEDLWSTTDDVIDCGAVVISINYIY
ncbi:MAG: hypothetical protein PQJ46_04680 [Spirochaetales bacterium]|nr:hypothetical protein [Spirochaetales bacterium]